MSESLITRIMEDKDIKRALYPPVGPNASTSKGGGKTKVSSHWQLAKNLLGDDPRYKDALAAVKTAKGRTAAVRHTDSWRSRMAQLTREYIDEMGQTGAGIRSRDDIDTSLQNTFTTKWGMYSPHQLRESTWMLISSTDEILSACPWFFDMRDLIAQRPNLVPTGLGHSGSSFDDGVLSADPPAPEPTHSSGDAAEEIFEDDSSDAEADGHTLSQINESEDFPAPHELDRHSIAPTSETEYRPSDDVELNADNDEQQDCSPAWNLQACTSPCLHCAQHWCKEEQTR
ncbi:hypothetical protein FB451DRAFT_1248800 [Mycena latifolia]|nr:hypothetical protein FB451DRAFT_1248800 [Mycena latifolia]